MNKTIFAASLAAAFLAPSFAFAMSPLVTVADVAAAKPKIVDLAFATQTLSWSTAGEATVELSLRCKGNDRLRAEHEDGTVSYVQCNGKNQVAYRGAVKGSVDAEVSLSSTGNRPIKVFSMLKLVDTVKGNKARVADKEKVTAKVMPAFSEDVE